MPIRGLTDRGEQFPIIGQVRKGAAKAEGSNRPGADLTYFRYVAQPGEDESAERFLDAFGPQPRILNVYLPYQTADENLQAWREEWVAGGLVHRCDGEYCVLWRNEHGEMQRAETAATPHACPGGCKQVGRLTVILPDFERLALVVVMTTSLYDILGLMENLRALEALRHDCRGIPLALKRKPRRISAPEVDRTGRPTGKRVRREKWLLTLEAAPEWVGLQIEAMRLAALPNVGRQRQIGPGGEIATAPQIAANSRVLDLAVDQDDEDEDVTEGEVVARPAAASEADREFNALPSRGEELRQQAATKAAAEAAAADEHPVQTQLPHTARPATAQPPAAQPQAAKQPPAAAATPAPAQPQAAPTRKEKPPRPWDAATTIAALRQAAEYGKRHPLAVVINESYSVAIGLLDKISSDYDRRILIRAVWGVESAKDLTAEQKWSLASWAAPAKIKEEDGTESWVLPKNVQDEFFTVALETSFSEKPTF